MDQVLPKILDGNTPLHFAAKNGHSEIVQQFMDWTNQNKSIDVNAKNQSGFTPLHYASENGHFDVVQCLLNYAMDKNPRNAWGNTPLHYAAIEGKFLSYITESKVSA